MLFIGTFIFAAHTAMQLSCKKEEEDFIDITREECIECLKGEWIVQQILRQCADGLEINYLYLGDTIRYQVSPSFINYYYCCNDSILCNLPFNNNLGIWAIQFIEEELVLVTEDYCGRMVNYSIELLTCNYNRDEWETGTWGNPVLIPAKSKIYFKMTLTNPDTVITFNEFTLLGPEPFDEIFFLRWENDNRNLFSLFLP